MALYIIEADDWDGIMFVSLIDGPDDLDMVALRGEFHTQYNIPSEPVEAVKKMISEGFVSPWYPDPDVWIKYCIGRRHGWIHAFLWWLVKYKNVKQLEVSRFDFAGNEQYTAKKEHFI